MPAGPGGIADRGAVERFIWESPHVRVVLAAGSLDAVVDEVDRLGVRRALVVGGTRSTAAAVTRLAGSLGGRVAGTVGEIVQHVPSELAETARARARELGADGVVSVGGGSATGLGKAVARSLAIPLVAVPTTYSGSEMTPFWGETSGGRKVTGRDPLAQPRAVVYDPELCVGMPPALAAASGMNALAHCVEAMWAAGRSPMTTAFAAEGVRRLMVGLDAVVADPDDVDAHAGNLAAACLAGATLLAGTGVHHRTCHVLGGWGMPHAETHAALLPYSTALVAPRAPEAVARIAELLGTADAASGLWRLREHLGLPASLAALGLPPAALDEAAARAAEAVSRDPLVPGAAAVEGMLDEAFRGRPPRRPAAA